MLYLFTRNSGCRVNHPATRCHTTAQRSIPDPIVIGSDLISNFDSSFSIQMSHRQAVTMTVIQYCHTTVLSYCHTVIVSYPGHLALNFIVSSIPMRTRPFLEGLTKYYDDYYPVLSYCHTVILSYCHSVILSYCHTPDIRYSFSS